MLKCYSITNLNSIKKEIFFTMEAENELKEHKSFYKAYPDDMNLLKVASIYGPNAGGKSNVLRGLLFIKDFLMDRFVKQNSRRINQSSFRTYKPFIFGEINNDLVLSVQFRDHFYDYSYEATLRYLKYTDTPYLSVITEHFYFKEILDSDYTLVFKRNENGVSSEQLAKDIGVSKFVLSNSLSVLSWVYKNFIIINESQNMEMIQPLFLTVIKKFYEELSRIVLVEDFSTQKITNYMIGRKLNKNTLKSFVVNSLNNLDINIEDIIVKENGPYKYDITCMHSYNEKSHNLPLELESLGTRHLINYLAFFYDYLRRDCIVVIDELDSHLHPKLIKELLKLFNSYNNKQSQLIFNSHDIWNMIPENFRRDQIWYAFRNDFLETEIQCLADIINYKGERVRKDAKYGKQYMEGKYGADPFIKQGGLWNESLSSKK